MKQRKHLTRDDARLLIGFLALVITPEIIERVLHLFGV